MRNEPRFVGSGAFYNNVRRNRSNPSASASPVPNQILNEIFKRKPDGVSVREIADLVELSVEEAASSLRVLENLGLVEKLSVASSQASEHFGLSKAGVRAHELAYLAVA